MLIQKNTELKESATRLHKLMANQRFTKQELINNKYTGEEEIVTITTDSGSYSHPLNMNQEMAKRFEVIARYSNINEPNIKNVNARSKFLQELYHEFKKLNHNELINMRKVCNDKFKSESSYRYCNHTAPLWGDRLYVIDLLLKTNPL